MRAVHWLRSHQEERELAYWLSWVAYEQSDRSFINRIYLLYLIIYLGALLFASLIFFASGGAFVLRWLNPVDPIRSALFLEVLLLGVWSVFAFWLSFRRSPIVFSEQDEVLICQTPVNRRHLTLRWILMPWLKSGVVFWLTAIVLGFSVAEITMPGAMSAGRIFEYAGYGLRSWAVILPIQLGLFALQWVVGILRLQKDVERRWLAWLVIPGTIAFFWLLLSSIFSAASASSILWHNIVTSLTSPLYAGFSSGNIGHSLLSGGLFALVVLGIMVWISGSFSLTRAAQETREVEILETAQRYGFSAYATQIQDQRRLGVRRAPSKLPELAGAGVLIWKDILQSQRALRLSSLFIWLRIFLLMLGFALLPDLGSRALVMGYWVIQIGQVSVVRIRSDLSRWSLVRQLPIPPRKILLFDLVPVYLLSLLISLTGLFIGSAIFKTSVFYLAIILPGIAASVAGMAAFDVTRRARSNLLIAGSAPDVGAGGILLGLAVAAVPMLTTTLLPGSIGLILSFLLSLGLGVLAFNLAVRSFRAIGDS